MLLTFYGFYVSDGPRGGRLQAAAGDEAANDVPPAKDATQHPGAKREQLHAGILLLPEVEQHVTLVAPPLQTPNVRRSPSASALTSVPFAGEYAIYYWFMKGPPKNALVTRGTPSEFRFSTTDRTALKMEARQNLGRMLDVGCCSRIDIGVWDEDPSPGTVGLEVLLVNTTLPAALPESLGEADVTPASTGRAESRLQFPMPARSHLRTFNEIRVVFHLRAPRTNRSARVDIKRLYFVPKNV